MTNWKNHAIFTTSQKKKKILNERRTHDVEAELHHDARKQRWAISIKLVICVVTSHTDIELIEETPWTNRSSCVAVIQMLDPLGIFLLERLRRQEINSDLSRRYCLVESTAWDLAISTITPNACGVMVSVAGYGQGDTSSNPGPDWLHFT